MTHTYTITGMTCGNCEAKVKAALQEIPKVDAVTVSKEMANATVKMSKHIPLSVFQTKLAELGTKYTITADQQPEIQTSEKSWWATYKPVLLIFLYLFVTTALIELSSQQIDFSRWMRHFMGGFFLTFSFFKLLNLEGFKTSYAMYDIVAAKFPAWGYVYAFIEVALGIAFLININPVLTNSVTLIVMSVSIIGVLKSVLNKQKIKCACLGDVFNLPMSTVTIIEDGLMIVMSLTMLLMAI